MVVGNLPDINATVRRLIYKKFPSNAKFSLSLKSYPERVSRILNGYQLISREEARKWARILDVPLEKLASITKPPGRPGRKPRKQTERPDPVAQAEEVGHAN